MMSIAPLTPEPQAIAPFRANGIHYTARRRDLDDATAAIELAVEYVGKLGDFGVSSQTDIRDRLVVARDSLVLD
jgi:hypothetical protein